MKTVQRINGRYFLVEEAQDQESINHRQVSVFSNPHVHNTKILVYASLLIILGTIGYSINIIFQDKESTIKVEKGIELTASGMGNITAIAGNIYSFDYSIKNKASLPLNVTFEVTLEDTKGNLESGEAKIVLYENGNKIGEDETIANLELRTGYTDKNYAGQELRTGKVDLQFSPFADNSTYLFNMKAIAGEFDFSI